MRFVYIFSAFICFSPRRQTVRTGSSPHSGKRAENASPKQAKGSHTKNSRKKVFNTYVDKIYNKLIINILQYGKSGLKVGDKQVENRPGKDGNAPQNAGIKAGLFRLQKATCKPPYGCTCRPSKKISHSPRPAGLLSGSQPVPAPKDAKRQHTSAHPAGLRKERRGTQTPAPIMNHAGQSGKTRSDPVPPKSDPVISGSHLFPAKSHRMRPVSDRKPHIPLRHHAKARTPDNTPLPRVSKTNGRAFLFTGAGQRWFLSPAQRSGVMPSVNGWIIS